MDLYAHIGPTLRRLLPWGEPSFDPATEMMRRLAEPTEPTEAEE